MSLTKPLVPRQKQRKPNNGNDNSEIKCQQPIIPMSKVSLDVIKKLQTQPYPQLTLATHSTISDALELYYNEYVRLFKQNQILNDELASILLERNNLADQFNQIKKKMKSYDDNIRRRRRYASQIQRNYHCPMPKCNKGYGSQGSLTHHVRLKHPKFFQSGEYEIYLETYILPKQEIKNEDGKGMIDVESLDEVKINNNDVKGKKNKIEIQDNNDVKQAKQEEIVNLMSALKSFKDKKANEIVQKQASHQQKQPQTPHLTTMMRQVDGYMALSLDNQNINLGSNNESGKKILNKENKVDEKTNQSNK